MPESFKIVKEIIAGSGVVLQKVRGGVFKLSSQLGHDAPSDTKFYGRKNGAWAEVNRGVAVFVSETEPLNPEINDVWIQI